MANLADNSKPRQARAPAILWIRKISIERFGSGEVAWTRKSVLWLLASYGNPNGSNCFPSVEQLAADMGFSTRSVIKHLSWLRENGFITSERSGPRPTHGRQRNCYRIIFSDPDDVNPASCNSDRLGEAGRRVREPGGIPYKENVLLPTIVPTKNQNLSAGAEADHSSDFTLTADETASAKTSHDPRHAIIRDAILKAHKKKFGIACEWGGSEGKALAELLKSNPSWAIEQLLLMVDNRFASDIAPDRPRKWIAGLGGYVIAPLDRYGKPRTAQRHSETALEKFERLRKGLPQ